MATTVTLATGRVLDVAMAYEDARQVLTTRDAMAEVMLTDGRRKIVYTNTITGIEEARERRAVGFR